MAPKQDSNSDQPQGFLATLDPVRIIIYLLLAAILLFSGLLIHGHWQLKEYETQFQFAYQSQLERFFETFWTVRKLQREIESSGEDLDEPFDTMIEKAVRNAGLDMNDDGIMTGSEQPTPNRREGFINVNRRIQVGDRKRGAPRQNIFWVLFEIQNKARYSVTSLNLQSKGDLEDDRWAAVAQVTSRTGLNE